MHALVALYPQDVHRVLSEGFHARITVNITKCAHYFVVFIIIVSVIDDTL